MSIEVNDDGAWVYRRRSCGELPHTPLHEVLEWILEQLQYGHFDRLVDNDGDCVALTLGRSARLFKADAAEDGAQKRDWAVQLAGILARAREQGIEPDFVDLSERATVIAHGAPEARMNTEFHYAFEMVGLLRRIAASTFLFVAPPVMGVATPAVVDVLREATRCFLFGLARPSIAACRTCLEAMLEDCVQREQVLQERWQSKGGELECLINAASRSGQLSKDLTDAAHFVRRTGNVAAHGGPCSDESTWDVLVQTRRIAEHLYGNQTP